MAGLFMLQSQSLDHQKNLRRQEPTNSNDMNFVSMNDFSKHTCKMQLSYEFHALWGMLAIHSFHYIHTWTSGDWNSNGLLNFCQRIQRACRLREHMSSNETYGKSFGFKGKYL